MSYCNDLSTHTYTVTVLLLRKISLANFERKKEIIQVDESIDRGRQIDWYLDRYAVFMCIWLFAAVSFFLYIFFSKSPKDYFIRWSQWTQQHHYGCDFILTMSIIIIRNFITITIIILYILLPGILSDNTITFTS